MFKYNLENIALKLVAHRENMKVLICDPFKNGGNLIEGN
jgi:hypothetical protein